MRNSANGLLTVVGIALACLGGCSDDVEPGDVALDKEKVSPLGWMHGNCLAIRDDVLTSGTAITIHPLGSDQQVFPGTITGRASSADDCFVLKEDRKQVNIDGGYFFYTINAQTVVTFAIGEVGEKSQLSAAQFSSCMTTEGMKFSVIKDGAELWQGYYYLGYESEPTCPPG